MHMVQEGDERALGRQQRRQFSHVELMAASFILVAVLAQVMMTFFVGVTGTLLEEAMDPLNERGLVLILAVPMYLIAFPVSVALAQLIPKYDGSQRQCWGTGKFTACFMITAGMGPAGNLLGQLVEWFKSSGLGNGELDRILMSSGIWITVLFTVVVAPTMEELFFRKLLMDQLLGFREGPTISVSDLMFGMTHGNFSQFFYTFGIGSLQAYVYAEIGRVSYTIVLHMVFNFPGEAILVELSRRVESSTDSPWFLRKMEYLLNLDFSGIMSTLSGLLIAGYLLFTMTCLIDDTTILVLYREETCSTPGIQPIQRRRRFRTVFLNPEVIIYFLICIGSFVLS